MSVKHGKNGKVKFSSNAIAELTRISFSEDVETADTTVMGDAARTHLPGIPGWQGTVEGRWDPDDTNGQGAMTIGASVTIGFYLHGDDSGETYAEGTGTITRINRDSDLSKAVDFSFEVMGNGALTYDTV